MKLNNFEFALMNNPINNWVQEYVEIRPLTDVDCGVKRGKVLEIGCGTGNGSRLINKYFHPSQIVAIDLDPKMVAIAKKDNPSTISFEEGDVTSLRFQEGSFEGVFDLGVLHHIPNWKEAISEIRRVLKKGGKIFAVDLSIGTFQAPLGIIMRPFLDHPYTAMYKTQELIDYLEIIGFELNKIQIRRPLGLIEYFIVVATKK